MCKILSRIKLLAENEGITIGALERKIGASKGVLSRAISNGTDIQSKWLVSIVENYPRYSAQWLLTGRGDMFVDMESKGNSNDSVKEKDPSSQILLDLIDKKDNLIREQCELIGRLKETIDKQGESLMESPSLVVETDVGNAL